MPWRSWTNLAFLVLSVVQLEQFVAERRPWSLAAGAGWMLTWWIVSRPEREARALTRRWASGKPLGRFHAVLRAPGTTYEPLASGLAARNGSRRPSGVVGRASIEGDAFRWEPSRRSGASSFRPLCLAASEITGIHCERTAVRLRLRDGTEVSLGLFRGGQVLVDWLISQHGSQGTPSAGSSDQTKVGDAHAPACRADGT